MKDVFSGEEIPNTKSDLPVNVNFAPDETVTMPSNVTSVHPTDQKTKPFEVGLEKEPYHAGVFETAKAEFKKSSSLVNLSETKDRQLENSNPLDDIVDPNWKPTNDPSKFDVDTKYKSYLMGSTSQKDLARRYSQVLDYQQRDKLIENGSTLGWLLGGFAGLSPMGSPESLIPIAGQVKYARYAPTILNSMGRALPGLALGSIAHEATINATKVSGNLEDFVVDSFADIAFGEAFAGAGAFIGRAIDSGALYDLRKTILPHYHGIDFKLEINPEGKIAGYKAFDALGGNSADTVSYAQNLADSTFAKIGFFKLPYIGDGTAKAFGVFSPVMRMLNSPYQTVRATVDRVANHSIITEGIRKGTPAPQKFENEMDKVKGQMRVFSAHMDALHLVRNGIDISDKSRARVQGTSYLKELKGKLSPEGYTSVEQFHSEIDHAVRSGESSPHAAVNEASGMIRNILDDTYTAYRTAYNLPKDWLPPKTAQNYLMRVYNTPYMNLKANEWNDTVSGWLREADEEIQGHLAPINDLEEQIKNHEQEHGDLIARPNITNKEVRLSSNKLEGMKRQKKALQENLQNEMRTNPDMILHVDDVNALSADEAKEMGVLTKRRDIALKEVGERKAIISGIKAEISKRESAAVKGKTVKTAKGNKRKSDTGALVLQQEETKLAEVKKEYDEELIKIQEKIHNGEVNPRLYTKEEGAFVYHLKDPNDRLKFRDTYNSHSERQTAARAYYDTIMNQTPEQLTAQVMHKLTGGGTSPLKQRTLLIPDKLLADNKFLSTNLTHNVINYKYFLGRRTILKQVFNDVTHNGGFESVIKHLSDEHNFRHKNLSNNLKTISDKRKELSDKLKEATTDVQKEKINNDKKGLDAKQKKVEKALAKEAKTLETAMEQMKIVYDKMMGNRVFGKTATKYGNMLMSYTSAIKLGFVPFSQITDLSANILQHGLWPFIRDGVVPAIESLGGALKTKDSEALRRSAPHVSLALQDVLTGYADKNFAGQAQPYFNLGSRVANGLEGLAHFSSNMSGTNYIDNGLQHIAGSIAQSTFMEFMHAFKKGELSKSDHTKLLQYGLDPKEWADRFIKGFEQAGAHKTKLGGYNSNFWMWSDLEAANKFGDAVFRGIKDTVLQRGMLDAPFFMDHPLGAILMAFKGWTFASLNRYVIPAMQKADGEKLIGMSFMLAAGALVSPARRVAAGKDPYPDDVTPQQIAYAAMQDSGIFSFFGDALADMNVLSGGWLLGNLRNDRYRDRTMAGLLGPTAGIANDLYSIIGSMASREVNQADVNKMIRLIPLTQVTELRALTNKFTDSLDIPKTRAQAHKMKSIEG